MINWNYPKTVDQAVERLILDLSLKDRVYIANLAQEDLYQNMPECPVLMEDPRSTAGMGEGRPARHCPALRDSGEARR